MNRLITRNEIESVILKTPCKQKFRTGWLPWRIPPNIKRTNPILLKLFQKLEEIGALPNSLYETTITLIKKKKTEKILKRKLKVSIVDEYSSRNPQQNISKPNPKIQKRTTHYDLSCIQSRVIRMVQHMQIKQWHTSR